MCERERRLPSPIARAWVRVEKKSQQIPDLHLRGGDGEEAGGPLVASSVHLRGGSGSGFSLFGYKPPKGDAKRGKTYLDEPVGPMWMFVGGTGTCGTLREFMKLSRKREAKGEEIKEKARQQKIAKAKEKAEKAAEVLAEMEAKYGRG